MALDIYGFIPFTSIRLPGMPAMGMDWALSRRPIRDALNALGFSCDQLRALLYSEGTLKGKSYDFAFNYKACSTCGKVKSVLKDFYRAYVKNGKPYAGHNCKKCISEKRIKNK